MGNIQYGADDQSSSTTESFLSEKVVIVQEDIFRHARLISEIALLSYEDFLESLGKLNSLSQNCLDVGGKQLKFAVKKGTDTTILWKGTVRVACVKFDPDTNKVDSYRLLTLIEFLKILKTIQCQLSIAQQSKSSEADNLERITASTLLNTVDEIAKGEPYEQIGTECCICLERKPEVMLPCAHSYCLACIEQWNVNHKTCPICRETLASTDDTWVLPDVPQADEISKEIRSSLMRLAGDTDSPKT